MMLLDVLNNAQNTGYQTCDTCDSSVWTIPCYVARWRLVSSPCRWFCQWLEESSKDFRVGAEALKGLRYAVFGCGNSLYNDNFNKASVHHLLCRPEGSCSLRNLDSEGMHAFHLVRMCVLTV